jgi:hypothetical protein
MPIASSLAGIVGYGRMQKLASVPTNKNVLLLWDTDNTSTNDLVSYLTTNGYTVTKSSRNAWNATNPALTNFGSVIMMNGTTYATNLNTAGQTALVGFVNGGGKFVNSEWDAYQVGNGQLANMIDLILAVRSSGATSTRSYTIVSGYTSHPLFSGLTSPIAIPNTGYNVGGVRSFASNAATAIAFDQNGNAAVIIRNYGLGKIVYFNHAANFSTGVVNNANVMRLYLNALNW